MTTEPLKAMPLRHELKHRINLREDLVLSQRLRKLFLHDKNAGPDGTYPVSYTHLLRQKQQTKTQRQRKPKHYEQER